ncbi:class I SAM-dependent methyltransferase [Chloroflexota bacterium]
MPPTIHQHFSKIANRYRYIRTTDSEPITFIAKELRKLAHVEAADIGCGDGRYCMLLFKYLGDKLRLVCIDNNNAMLEELDTYFRQHNVSNFKTMKSEAESLPFPDGILDCVCTFNAIHHFDVLNFLHESARILKVGGYIFIYTRLREQNRENIWGQYFPEFCQKEDRLYKLNTLMETIAAVSALRVKSIEYFKYRRVFSLEKLIERARDHHYSTFTLYSPNDLEEAIIEFAGNIEYHFENIQRVNWFDQYTLFVIRKEV